MKKGTTVLTTVAVIICIVALALVTLFAPFIARWFVGFRLLSFGVYIVILVAYYLCVAPALISLISLLKILANIRRNEPFKHQNTVLISRVSWCCVAVAAVTLWAGFFYMPMWFISGAMLFVFLILRVVRGCFIAAGKLDEENSLTI